MKKNLKLVLALILAAMMIVGSISALAANGDLNVNGNLTVAGLDAGDEVRYYQILAWGPSQTDPVDGITDSNGDYVLVGNPATPTGWVWGPDIKTDSTLTNDDLLKIIGANDGSGQISSEMAGKIAANVVSGKTAETVSGTEWEKTVTAAGLYMVTVDPAVQGTLYNPIFVAANWYSPNETPDTSNSITIKTSEMTYSNKGMAKKSNIPLDKKATANDQYKEQTPEEAAQTTDVGDEIEFSVDSKIPKFSGDYFTGENYPVFKLHDVLDGVKLKASPVVTAGSTTLTKDTDYTLTKGAANDTEYTIQFTKSYLQNIPAAGQEITITYTGIVTEDATKIVDPIHNTVDLIFSTTPSGGKSALRDVTNHYTFSLDADLYGGWEGKGSSTEAIKVGMDKDGNVIMESKYYAWSDEWHGALEGAEFELHVDNNGKPGALYTNDKFNGKATSDASGRITMNGLDVGKYWLVETKAPSGFIKAQDPIPVEITAVLNQKVDSTAVVDADGTPVTVTYITNQLESYTVKVGGSTTTYHITNSSDHSISDVGSPAIMDEEIVNTKGVELPSTGGMGTTIFYVGGSILVLAAAILLVTKRRMGVED